MRTYISLFGVDAIALAIALYFFAEGVGDGTVSSFNILLWLGILGGLGGTLFAGWYLRTRGQIRLANVVLAIVGVPAVLAGVFFLSLIIEQPRWN